MQRFLSSFQCVSASNLALNNFIYVACIRRNHLHILNLWIFITIQLIVKKFVVMKWSFRFLDLWRRQRWRTTESTQRFEQGYFGCISTSAKRCKRVQVFRNSIKFEYYAERLEYLIHMLVVTASLVWIKTTLGHRMVIFRASVKWSNLPKSPTDISSFDSFKKGLQLYLISNYQ